MIVRYVLVSLTIIIIIIVVMEMDSYMHVGPSISGSSKHTKKTPLHLKTVYAQFWNKYLTNKQNNPPKDSRSTESTSKADKLQICRQACAKAPIANDNNH